MKLVYLLLAILGTIASQTEQHAIPSQQDKGATRLQLAKTGDREALQYFACQSLTTNVLQMENMMRTDLDPIGGDFTIVPDASRLHQLADDVARHEFSIPIARTMKLQEIQEAHRIFERGGLAGKIVLVL